MKRLGIPSFLLLVFCANYWGYRTAIAADMLPIPRWQPHDFAFPADVSVPNPFLVDFSAAVTGPNGITFTLPGFYDGKGIWKIRAAPTAEGQWSLTTKSALPELDGKTVKFSCAQNTNPNIHGVLRVDRDHPHHFVYDDGTRFFMQAYEYDWLWALDMGKPTVPAIETVPTVRKSLALLAQHGFNYIILDSYAYDTKWKAGKSGPDDFGPASSTPGQEIMRLPIIAS